MKYLIETEDPINTCVDCPCLDVDGVDERIHLCGLAKKYVTKAAEKPKWCPLVKIDE